MLLELAIGDVSCARAWRMAATWTPSRRSRSRAEGKLAIREGDIVVGTFDATLSSISYSRENAIANPNMKWAKGRDGRIKVPYTFNANLPSNARAAINQAIADYKKYTCADFVPRTASDQYFVDFFQEDGCWSEVGNNRRVGGQKLSIGRGCEYKGTVLHEMMHALGFDHEQNRPDRDQYITINWQNVESGMEDQFETCRDCTTQNLPYDYLSVMHYGRDFFTKNGLDTMVPKQKGARFSDGSGFSKMDIQKLHKLYQCNY